MPRPRLALRAYATFHGQMLIGPYADPNQVEAEAWALLRQQCAHIDRAKLTPVRKFVPFGGVIPTLVTPDGSMRPRSGRAESRASVKTPRAGITLRSRPARAAWPARCGAWPWLSRRGTDRGSSYRPPAASLPARGTLPREVAGPSRPEAGRQHRSPFEHLTPALSTQ
jgi:hypothetical protein